MFEIESIMNVVSFSPEVLFTAGGILLNLLVLPTLLDSNAAIPRVQSVLTAFVLIVCFAVPYYAIGYEWSSLVNVSGFVLWSLVAVYRSPSQVNSSGTDVETANAYPAD